MWNLWVSWKMHFSWMMLDFVENAWSHELDWSVSTIVYFWFSFSCIVSASSPSVSLYYVVWLGYCSICFDYFLLLPVSALFDKQFFLITRDWFLQSFSRKTSDGCWSSICSTILCGLRGCKNRPAPFPGRMSYGRLNEALSVLSLSLGFFWVCMLCCLLGPLLHYVICVFYLLVVLVRLSVPVQVIDWKYLSPK